MYIKLSGIGGADCECGQLNREVYVPKTTDTGSFCGGVLDIQDACEGGDDVDTYNWTLSCGEEGTTLTILIDPFYDGGQVVEVFQFDPCVNCGDVTASKTPVSPGGTPTCDWSSALLEVRPSC